MIYEKSIRTVADAVVADGCVYHLLGEQLSGDMRNLKPGGASPIKDPSFTDLEAWANPGYMTTGADGTAIATLAQSESAVTLAGLSLIIGIRMKKATPAGTEPFVSSIAPGASFGGFIIDARNTGSGIFTMVALPSGSNGLGLPNIADGNEHTTVIFVPRNLTSSMECWVDGVFKGTGSAAAVAGLDCKGIKDLRIGSGYPSISAVSSQIAMLCAYQVPKDLGDINKALIADYLFRNPGMPLENWHL